MIVRDTPSYSHTSTYQISLTYLERQKSYGPDKVSLRRIRIRIRIRRRIRIRIRIRRIRRRRRRRRRRKNQTKTICLPSFEGET